MVAVFEVGWREVAEGGMAALAVVEDLDVLEDSGPGLLPGGPVLAVEQLGLEGGEEALGDGVVPAGAGAADALAGVPVGQPGRVGAGEVLGAAVGVVDLARESSACSVRWWSASDQPTTRRECASRMAARYSQPSSVRT
jgi:hypothetical protein